MISRKPTLNRMSKMVSNLKTSPEDHLSKTVRKMLSSCTRDTTSSFNVPAYVPTAISSAPTNQNKKLNKNIVYFTQPDM